MPFPLSYLITKREHVVVNRRVLLVHRLAALKVYQSSEESETLRTRENESVCVCVFAFVRECVRQGAM